MHIPPTGVGDERRPRLLTFARSHDAQLCAVRADLTTAETTRLRSTLDGLVEIGAVALYRLDTPLNEAGDWQALVGHLREHVGSPLTDAAIAAAEYPATPTPKPQTLVPVWPFERLDEDPDVLTACGLFMGTPIRFEALPVLDADLAQPAPHVAARFAAWHAALGQRSTFGTVAVPGSDAAHAVFAAVQAA